MDDPFRVKSGKSLDGIASTNAVSEVYDILVSAYDMTRVKSDPQWWLWMNQTFEEKDNWVRGKGSKRWV